LKPVTQLNKLPESSQRNENWLGIQPPPALADLAKGLGRNQVQQ